MWHCITRTYYDALSKFSSTPRLKRCLALHLWSGYLALLTSCKHLASCQEHIVDAIQHVQCSGWNILVRHARYFTSCIFTTWFLSIVPLRPHSFILQTSRNTEEFIMSLLAELMTGYHHARHTVKLPSILVQSRWLSLGIVRGDTRPWVRKK